MNNRLEIALYYASKFGWHIFPLHSIRDGKCSCRKQSCDKNNQGKHPRIKKRDGGSGVDDATTDEKQIRIWWTSWPDANIGLACGRSGLVVLDIDPRNDGDNTLSALEAKHGALASTPRQLTGGGGIHYLFRKPSAEFRGSVIPDGIDIKADGGYVVLAPSNHLSGRDYVWDVGAHPDDIEIAELPQWVIDECKREKSDAKVSELAPEDGYLGAAFLAAGWAGHRIDATRIAVQCPWESEHSCGSRFDGSTVVFAPNQGGNTGHFWCAHSHCQTKRTLKDVLKRLPAKSHRAARKTLGLPDEHKPAPESRKPEQGGVPIEAETWESSLRTNSEGKLTRDPGNAALILANDVDWKGCLQYDAFAGRVLWQRPVPALEGMPQPVVGDELQDHHVLYLQQWFARRRHVSFGREAIETAIGAAARANSVHPLQDYLRGLKWDGVSRAGNWLPFATGCADDDYSRSIGQWWLVSAIARALRPGTKVDHMLIVKGRGGIRKSMLFMALAGEQWCLESVPRILDKDALQVMRGKWICVFNEMKAFRSNSNESIYDFLTRQIDTYRPSYGRAPVNVPRCSVFGGTTNEQYCLPDDTGGNRRFWPIDAQEIRIDWITENRDQLWAEATQLYSAGTHWYPIGNEQTDMCAEAQASSEGQDAWEETIREWLETKCLETRVTVSQILSLALFFDKSKINRGVETRIGQIMRRLGYVSKQLRSPDGSRFRFYEKPKFTVTQAFLGMSQPTSQPFPQVVVTGKPS